LDTPPQSRSIEEAKLLLRYKKLDVIAGAVQLLIPWGSAVLIAGFMYLMVSRLSGQTTLAQIGIGFMGDIRLPDALAYAFGGGGFLYGLKERRLRHKKTETLAQHAAKLEELLDKNRTTSGLTPEGTTRREDIR
jgi:hypothetical protein